MLNGGSRSTMREPCRKKQKNEDASSTLLPIDLYANSIVTAVAGNDVTFIHAETGSGKSTKIPQLLNAHITDILKGRSSLDKARQPLVVVVQPRRIAAISLARYVATTMGEQPGHTVGHEVRLSQCRTPHTRILYITEGILLNWVRPGGSHLSSVSILVLDEIHERSMSLDLVCGLLVSRPTLLQHTKLILMSATACYDTFRRFFGDHSITYVQIPGRLHQIHLNYIDNLSADLLAADYFTVLVRLVRHLHKTEPLEAGILVFLPGQAEINTAFRLITDGLRDQRLYMDQEFACRCIESVAMFKLYSLLPLTEQNKCLHFKTNISDPVYCKRKIVLATNIAETSLTIPGIRIVIDLGLSRISRYYPTLHMTALETCSCSREQAEQRKGRAGREGPGQCYRLYTEQRYLQLPATAEPEMCRSRSEPFLLWLTANELALRTFPLISPPPLPNLAAAYDELYALSIIDTSGNLTEVGSLTFEFSVMFQHGRMLAEVILDARSGNIMPASVYRELIVVVSCVETFMNTDISIQWDTATKAAGQRLKSDHLALLALYNSYTKVKYKADWCHAHGISHHLMQYCKGLVEQLSRALVTRCPDLPKLTPPQDSDLAAAELRRYIKLGYGIQCARINQRGSYSIVHSASSASEQPSQLVINPKSLLAHTFPRNIVFTTAIKTTDVTLHLITALDDV